MSGPQWELVTKNKKDKTANGAPRKLTKTEKKKFVENAPKVEDLCKFIKPVFFVLISKMLLSF